ncbi:MAG: acyltransferase family protein [Actinobacteria bacterium]|nr:acyltransferase family protein [Actinomycetota bacterium]MBO0784873.1 acyltransferase family protein [Actinomycetota bacterium]
MPEPVRSGQRYLPGLDGLRALAVLAVIAYHVQFGWAPGGLLGVGVFFTLSGYLITDLLLGQWAATGRLHLGDFWLRRARRLLPALFVMLALVTAWVTLLDRAQLAVLRGAVGAAAVYVSNWYLIAVHSSYFARFGPPEPLDHLWSLAVEEQFYLIWPWLLLLVLIALLTVRRKRAGGMSWLAVPTLLLAAASALAMLRFYHQGVDPTRVYEGTDTRAFGLLIGAALAMVWPSRSRTRPAMGPRLLLDGAGIAGLAVIAVMVWRVGEYSPFSYRGGLELLSVATAAVVAAVAVPGGLVGRALGWRPLRWIGVRSYGIYLWHYPIIVLTSPPNSLETLPRAAGQIAATIVIAALSWRFVEEPIRHGALGRMAQRARSGHWQARPTRSLAAIMGVSGVLVLAAAGLAGFFPAPGAGNEAAGSQSVGSQLPPPSRAAGQGSRHGGKPVPAGSGSPAVSPAASTGPGSLRTSCRKVVHIGDSTSEGMISKAYLPQRSLRLQAQYRDVGVRTTISEISGARSIVETLPHQTNAAQVAKSLVSRGYRGCWVMALGTNDTADVVVGSGVSRMARIERMMAQVHGQPVMWVNVKSLLVNGPYAEPQMKLWDQALLQACHRYPNLRVFDWASLARRSWFISDRVHYTSAGYAARGRLIAQALARAFPAHGHSSGCVVR